MDNKRKGLRVRYANGVQIEVRNVCIDFIKWVRKRMTFPIRVIIYIKGDYLIKTKFTKEYVPATFWGPYNLENEPHIRVATGDYNECLEKNEYYNTIAEIFDSIVHELIHYQQWLVNQTFKNGEREANKKAKQIVYEYLDYLDELHNSRVEDLGSKINAEALAELINMFIRCSDFIGEKIVKKLRTFTEFSEAQDFLTEQTKNTYYRISTEALISLSYFEKNEKTNKACLRCFYDKNDYVRLRAAEMASDLCNETIIPYLVKLFDDKNQLVRGYAAVSLGVLGSSENIPILEELLKVEKRNASKLRIYVALYELGKVDYFSLIVKQLKSKSFLVRGAASYYLFYLADKNNIDICIGFLKLAVLKEKDKEVYDTMMENLEGLKEYNKGLK